MRMWMVDPKIMCNRHLLGEHLEIHMFRGAILRKKSLEGYLKNNLFEPMMIKSRHDELADEITRRWGNPHKSPLLNDFDCTYLKEGINNKIDTKKSLSVLISRCNICRQRCGECGKGDGI